MRVWIDESVVVNADLQTVNALLVDIRRWPEWVLGLRRIRTRGPRPIIVGRRFSMTLTMPPIPWLWLPNLVFEMSSSLIEWGGGIPGTKIRHGFELTAIDEATTTVREYEYATTLLALVCRPIERAIYRHDHGWLVALQARYPSASDGTVRSSV